MTSMRVYAILSVTFFLLWAAQLSLAQAAGGSSPARVDGKAIELIKRDCLCVDARGPPRHLPGSLTHFKGIVLPNSIV